MFDLSLQQDDNLYLYLQIKQDCLSNMLDILYFYSPATAKVTYWLIWLGCCKMMIFK